MKMEIWLNVFSYVLLIGIFKSFNKNRFKMDNYFFFFLSQLIFCEVFLTILYKNSPHQLSFK